MGAEERGREKGGEYKGEERKERGGRRKEERRGEGEEGRRGEGREKEGETVREWLTRSLAIGDEGRNGLPGVESTYTDCNTAVESSTV